MLGDHVGGLDIGILHVDHAQAQFERSVELLEQVQILSAAAREFERQLLDLGSKNRGEQIAVAAFPGRLAVTVAVADVDGDPGVHTFH